MQSESEVRRAAREIALLGVALPLSDSTGTFGPALLPLTPWHALMLSVYANPIATGKGLRTLDVVLQYLWLCSPEFHALSFNSSLVPRHLSWSGRHWRAFRFFFFARRWRRSVSQLQRTSTGERVRAPTMRALRAIEQHLASPHLDHFDPPTEVGKKNSQLSSLNSQLIADGPHDLAAGELLCRRALGYSRAEFWHTPFAHTNQLLALHFAAQPGRPDVPKFDRARDKQKGDYLRAKLKRQAARPPSRN